MANIRLVGKCGSIVDDESGASANIGGAAFAFELVDGANKIPARFSMTSSATELPMAAITEYGMLVAALALTDMNKSMTITATPLDGSAAVSVTKTFTALIEATVPSLVTA